MRTTMSFVILFGILVLSPAVASAQTSGFVEGQFQFTRGTSMTPTVDVATDIAVGKSLSVSFWGLKTDGWGEFYVGATKSLASWVSISASVGLEQADSPWRLGSSLWLGNDKTSALLIVEEGGSGFWYKTYVSQKIAHRLSLGVYSQRFVGTGPYVEVGVGKMKFWSMPVGFGQGGTQSLSGVRYCF